MAGRLSCASVGARTPVARATLSDLLLFLGGTGILPAAPIRTGAPTGARTSFVLAHHYLRVGQS